MQQIYWAFDKYTSNLNISIQMTYSSHFYEELPNIIATKLQIICDQSQIWIQWKYVPNLMSVWQIHIEFEHFIAIVPIAVISI